VGDAYREKENSMTLLREAIGDSLRRARLAQSRTLREVSTSARVSLGYLSEVERGRKEASSELLAAICEALDVPLSRVLWDVSTAIAGEDLPAGVAPAREPAEVATPAPAEPAAEPAAAEPAAASAAAASAAAGTRTQVDGETRIVIPAPTNGPLVLVEAA
jgi:transcriptional regulator with XRE-family HTH domain